jgi:hypothetical protein
VLFKPNRICTPLFVYLENVPQQTHPIQEYTFGLLPEQIVFDDAVGYLEMYAGVFGLLRDCAK